LSYKVFLHPKVADFLKRITPQLKERIKKRLKELEDSPESKGERLKHTSFFRIRIGDYRAIYEIHSKNRRVIALFIGHRKEVYDNFSRLL